jgi:hypothetical protein
VIPGPCFKVGEVGTRKDYFWIQLCLVIKTKQNKALGFAE